MQTYKLKSKKTSTSRPEFTDKLKTWTTNNKHLVFFVFRSQGSEEVSEVLELINVVLIYNYNYKEEKIYSMHIHFHHLEYIFIKYVRLKKIHTLLELISAVKSNF